MSKAFVKMSKSCGNVVMPEEVVYGVSSVDPAYEFRDESGQVIDYREYGVWRDRPRTSMYFTDTRHGRRPVFLCETGNPEPCVLLIDGEERVQHAETLTPSQVQE